MRIILASKSPRRRELLKQIIKDFDIIAPKIDENKYKNDELSIIKAKEVGNVYQDSLIISADTLVYFGNIILGKPSSNKNAIEMLKMLSNNTHSVITYYTIYNKRNNICLTKKSESKVTFNKLSDSLIEKYVNTGSPLDKAGAYGIQDKNFNLVKSFTGDINNIIGLPINELKKDLIALGIKL